MSLLPALEQWQTTGNLYRVPPLGLRLFVIDLGDSSALANDTALLVHGFPESSFSFHKVVEGLQTRFNRIVLLDLPGYGFSDKPEEEYSYSLVAQADAAFHIWHQLGVSGGHLICHDMGTSVVTEMLSRFVSKTMPQWLSEGVQSVTFTNGSMALEYAQLRLMQKLLLRPKLGPLISSMASFSLFEKTILSAHGAKGEHRLREADIQGLWQSTTLQDGHKKNHHIIRYLNDRKRFEQTRWLPSLRLADHQLPIQICWGDADQVAVPAIAEYLHHSVCPNARLTVMQGAGHFCQLGSPQLWLDCVLPFFDDLT